MNMIKISDFWFNLDNIVSIRILDKSDEHDKFSIHIKSENNNYNFYLNREDKEIVEKYLNSKLAKFK